MHDILKQNQTISCCYSGKKVNFPVIFMFSNKYQRFKQISRLEIFIT